MWKKKITLGSVHYLKNLELNFVILSTSYLSLNFYLAGNNKFKILAKKIFLQVLSSDCIILLNTKKISACMHYQIITQFIHVSICHLYINIIYVLYNYNVSEVLYPPISYPSPLSPLCKTQLKSTNVCLNASWLFDKEYFTAKIISIQKNNLSPIKKIEFR